MTPHEEFAAHALTEYPRECCGLFIVFKGRERYLPCRNIASTPQEHFVLHPEDFAKAEEFGEIIALGHSHPNMLRAAASESDKVACEQTNLTWHIVSLYVPDDQDTPVISDAATIEPCGYKAPLAGRQFSHGVLDCYTLVQDYYREHMGMELPHFERRDDWWINGENLYLDNFEKAGFERIKGPIQVGDIILMEIAPTNAPNHAGVYYGDGLILQHLMNRLSSRDVYSGYFQQVTYMVIRHKSKQP